MQLVHMDVHLPGTHSKQLVGPLAPGLNAVLGPRGSGKTRLVKWLRQVTADTYGPEYIPASNTSAVDLAGDVELRNYGTSIRLSRDTYGRVRQSTSNHSVSNGSSRGLTQRQRSAFGMLADIHDGAAQADLALDDTARRLGLESRTETTTINSRDLLVSRERELVSRLEQLGRVSAGREDLLSRRRDIEHQLNGMRSHASHFAHDPRLDRNRLLDRFAAIEADLLGAESELQQIDQELARVRAELKQCEIGQQSVQIEASYREQLQHLEDRLNRWRKTLRDLKVHRESIENQETEAKLDQQVGTQLSATLTADPRAPMRSLEAQLHHARKQLDNLVGLYWPHATGSATGASTTYSPTNSAASPVPGYQVQRDPYGRTHISYDGHHAAIDHANLPEMLQSMQRDLHDICNQLSRQQAASNAAALKQQADQLRRSELELLNSVEQLIEERGLLLRKIADRYNLSGQQISLAFGDWCQCNDHPHLYDWLLQEDAPQKLTREVDSQARRGLEENFARLENQRRQALLRAEECRRQLREAGQAKVSLRFQNESTVRQAAQAELLRELDLIANQLAGIEDRDRVIAELDDVRRQLDRTPATIATASEYRLAVDRNVVALCGSLYQRSPLATQNYVTNRQYDAVNGVVVEQPVYRQHFEVPAAIVRVAQRLTIAQLLAQKGDAIPVVLDQTLDAIDSRLQATAIAHLALASQNLQVVILTDDSNVADLVRQYRGSVCGLQVVREVAQSTDVNRQLAAYANDHEADKWFQPAVEPMVGSEVDTYFLNPGSSIERHPSLSPEIVSICRELGIVTIGDLLNADADRLAGRIGKANIDANRISAWQATANLLCSVRNLRPFDARILVGSGIRSSQQLHALPPGELADRVEHFLSSEFGQRIMRSGNRFEQSRINNWIAAARRGSTRFEQAYSLDRDDYYGRPNIDRDRYERPFYDRPDYGRRTFERRSYERPESDRGHSERSANLKGHSEPSRATITTKTRSAVQQSSNGDSQQVSAGSPKSIHGRTKSNPSGLKFYLGLNSPVVDAPSIGERMAEKLNQLGVVTVEQLLQANADSLANKLAHRRVDGKTIRSWQHQAKLVCTIPNLRGHDAQLLVACGLTTPEALRNSSAQETLNKVLEYARTTEGVRILRGSKEPDLAEVNDWINWSSQSRQLNAA